MNAEDRLINIESKIAHQEDLLETLNQIVYRQQKKVDELEALCTALAMRLKEAAALASNSGERLLDERPPHY